jgi:hypothetical protein
MQTLKNDKITLTFNDDGCLVGLEGLGGVTVPIDAAQVTAPFELQLRDEAGKVVHVTPDRPAEISVSREGDTQVMILRWEIAGEWGKLQATGTVRLPNDSVLSYWTMAVENGTDRVLWQVAFPRVSGLADYEEKAPGWLAVPIMMGDKTPNPVSFVNEHEPVVDIWSREQYGCFDAEGGPADIAYPYPGYMAMQYLAYGHPESGGLYFGAYDSEALYKNFGMYADGDTGRHAVVQMKQYPRDRTERSADFESFYECPVGVYQGDWWNASAIYRDWALEQFWAAKGPVRDRDEVPRWVKENDLWYWNWQFAWTGHPRLIVPICKTIKERFECNVALHWYGSNGESGSWRTPEIYPCNEDIRSLLIAGVDELHAAGIHCIPYLLTRTIRPEIKSFRDNDGMKWVCYNEKGEMSDVWRGGPTVCPTAPFFHEIIRKQVELMVASCHMDGAYLDQLSGCYPVVCFTPNHPHPPGGHDHWVRGYRELTEKVRKTMRPLNPDSVITSEGVGECWLDLLDLDLAREVSDLSGHVGSEQSLPIPMFHSVYHDYHITYGTVSTFKPRRSGQAHFLEHFHYAEALTLVGGGQLMISGVFGGDEDKEKFRPFFEYMEKLTRARKCARNHFNLGRWLPPPAVDCDRVDVKYNSNRPPKVNIPAVLGGAFEYESEVVVPLVNHTEQERAATVDLAPERFGRTQPWSKATLLYPEQKDLTLGDGGALEMTCAPLGAYVLKLQ